MAGRTTLFQQAGSPLIQGHSRFERRFGAEWFLAFVVGVLLLAIGLVVLERAGLVTLEFGSTAVRSSARIIGTGLAAVAVAAAVIIWVARRLGWRRAWLLGGLVGAIAGIAVTLLVH